MNASELLKRLQPAAKLASPRSGIPIAQCLKIEPGRVVGSDWNAWLTIETPDLDLPSMCVSADRLMRALANAGDGDAAIEAIGESLLIKCGRRRITLPILPADEFPEPAAVGDLLMQYRGDALGPAIETAAPFMSTNEAAYHLCGVALYGGCAVAANNAGGCEVTVSALDAPADGSIILPRSAVGLISGEVDFVTDGKIAVAAMAGRKLVTRLVDGTFPDYRRVMPDDAPAVAQFSGARMLAIAKAACATISDDKSRAVKLTIDGERIALASNAGEFKDEMAADVGRDFGIIMNAGNLADAMDALGDGEIEWTGADHLAPQVFAAGTVRCVLMPMRG